MINQNHAHSVKSDQRRSQAMPTCARGAIGVREEMAKFKTALLKVMAQLQT